MPGDELFIAWLQSLPADVCGGADTHTHAATHTDTHTTANRDNGRGGDGEVKVTLAANCHLFFFTISLGITPEPPVTLLPRFSPRRGGSESVQGLMTAERLAPPAVTLFSNKNWIGRTHPSFSTHHQRALLSP